jgi:cytochrome c
MPKDHRTIRNTPVNEIQDILAAAKAKKGAEVYVFMKCPVCEKEYGQNRKWQKFCSVECRDGWHRFIRTGQLPMPLPEL